MHMLSMDIEPRPHVITYKVKVPDIAAQLKEVAASWESW